MSTPIRLTIGKSPEQDMGLFSALRVGPALSALSEQAISHSAGSSEPLSFSLGVGTDDFYRHIFQLTAWHISPEGWTGVEQSQVQYFRVTKDPKRTYDDSSDNVVQIVPTRGEPIDVSLESGRVLSGLAGLIEFVDSPCKDEITKTSRTFQAPV